MVELAHFSAWIKSRGSHQGWRYGGNALPSEMIALEPRVMLDGAAAVAVVAEAADQSEQSTDNGAADSASADPAAQASNSETDNGDGASESADTGQAGPATSQSVIIVDASVADAQTLLTGVDPSAHVFYLNAGSDGIQQITNILAGLSNVTDLHILSHGSTGSVTLGATALDASNIESYASQLVDWDVALAESADILLYGCNVGQDDAGMDFIDLFADLTNADVAASSDLTGSADLGGNWQLEVGTGPIEAVLPLSETARNAYAHVLAPPVLTNFDAGATYTEDGSPRRIDPNVEVSDVENDALNGGNGDYDGAGFVLERTGGGNTDDFIQFSPSRGVRLDGANLIESGTDLRFGTITLANGTVRANFTSTDTPATTALVNGTMQSLFYSNRSDTPPASVTFDLTFTDSDGNVATGTTQAVINIEAVDDATTVTDLPASLDFTEDTPLGNFDISASTFADVDSASISVTIEVAAGGTFTLADPAGLITIAGDGTNTVTLTGDPTDINTYLDTPANVRFSPPLNLSGAPATTATVTADNENGPVTLGTIDLNIAPVADDPDAVDDSVATDADLAFEEDDAVRAITADILGNDSDPDTGDTLTVTAIDTTGTTGLVTLVGGVVSYDPNGAFEALAAGASAVDTFTYTISDGNGGTDTATVTITVNGVNDAPNAVDDSVATDADLAFGEDDGARAITADILGNDSDPDTGDTLTVTAINTAGTTGLVTLVGGVVSYDPNGAFEALAAGASVVDTFTYTISDGNGGTDTATVTITINGANDAPDAVDDSVATDADLAFGEDEGSRAITADILGNDSDPDTGDTLTVTAIDATGTTGLVTLVGGVVSYDPNGAFEALAAGASVVDTFTYTISDGNGGTDTATVRITVSGANDAPDAVDDTEATDADLAFGEDDGSRAITADILGNDSDPDTGDTLTVTAINSAGTTGLVTLVGGVISYDPNGAFDALAVGASVVDTFTYTISDGKGGTDTATVSITINGANDAPVNTVPGPQATNEDTALVFSAATFNQLSIADVDAGVGNVSTVLTVASGTLAVTTGGGANVANDGTGTVTITGTVAQVNAALASVTYTPSLDFNGTDTLTVTTNDTASAGAAAALTDTDTVDITVTPVNDAPVNTVPGPQAVNEDTDLVFSAGNGNQLSITDVDAAGGTISTVLNVASGTLAVTLGGGATVSNDGTSTVTITGTLAQVNAALANVTYTPSLDFNGADALTLTTNDNGNTGIGGALTDTDTVTINVNPVNDAPVNSVPGPQATDNDIDLVFSAATGNLISISDIDAGAGTVTTTLVVPSGFLTAAAGSGAAIAGNGSANVTISGTLAQVNAALSVLTFTPNGLSVGTIALAVTTRDNGNTGGGNLSDTDQVSIELASGLGSTGTDGQTPSGRTGQSNDNLPSNFSDTPGIPIGFQNGNSGQDPLLGGLPGFGGGRPVDNIITAGIGDPNRSGNENGVSESDLPGNIELHPSSDTGFSNSDNTTGDATPLFTGKAPANSVVTITSSLGGILGTVTADENGQWRFTAPTLSDGVHELIATPKDENGNEGVPSVPLLATIDTLAPDTPPAPTLDGDIDQLRSNDTPTFKGKAEPGARIVLTSDPDGVVGEVIADENGNWQMTTGPLSENAHQLRLTATDAAGNTSPTSPALEFVVRGEDDTALNFDSTSPVLVDITGPDGSVGFDPITITGLLSGFTDQVDASHFEQTRSGDGANAMGFMRQLQKSGNTVNDQALSFL